jgi:hypothetical protein
VVCRRDRKTEALKSKKRALKRAETNHICVAENYSSMMFFEFPKHENAEERTTRFMKKLFWFLKNCEMA